MDPFLQGKMPPLGSRPLAEQLYEEGVAIRLVSSKLHQSCRCSLRMSHQTVLVALQEPGVPADSPAHGLLVPRCQGVLMSIRESMWY